MLKSVARVSQFLLAALIWLFLVESTGLAGPLALGREATPKEVAGWDIDVRPDGQGLPPGKGDARQGEEIFQERCAACHGEFGEGLDRWPPLAGGFESLAGDNPVKTVGSYWPYLSTVFDYIRRAMPFGDAQSLTPDEIYAITAYILYLNDLVQDEEFELSRQNFLSVKLPNETNFIPDPRPLTELRQQREPCMANCKSAVRILSRARVLDVTPESGKKSE